MEREFSDLRLKKLIGRLVIVSIIISGIYTVLMWRAYLTYSYDSVNFLKNCDKGLEEICLRVSAEVSEDYYQKAKLSSVIALILIVGKWLHLYLFPKKKITDN